MIEVVLDLPEDKIARDVVVSFIGSDRNHWSEGTSKNKRYYSETDLFLQLEQTLWTPPRGEESGVIPAGHYTFPFRFDIPDKTPIYPSFQDFVCTISYAIECRINRPNKHNHITFILLTVYSLTDINKPEYNHEVTDVGSKIMGCCCCKSPPIDADMRIPCASWCPGETIPVLIHVNNRTKKRLRGVSVSLEARKYYRVRYHSTTRSDFLKRKSNKDGIEPYSDYHTTIPLLIPACCPSFTSHLTDLDYGVVLTVHLPRGHFFLRLRTPIFIGSIPHIVPPLFPEDKARMTESGEQIPCTWANPSAIYSAAISSQHPIQSTEEECEYEDKYKKMQPIYYYPREGISYPYFTLPSPSIYSTPLSSDDCSSVDTPLLSTPDSSFDTPHGYCVSYPVDMPLKFTFSPQSSVDEHDE